MKKLSLYIALTGLITAICCKLAYMDRGYFAIGGEWLIWVVPLLVEAARIEMKEEQDVNM